MTETQYTAASGPFGRQRQPRIVATGIAVFILVAITKPWPHETNGQRPIGPGSSPEASTIAVANTAPPSAGPNTMACLAGDRPQVVTIERTGGRQRRSWIAVVDEQQPGPVGLRQVPISIFSTHVIGLGVCAPDRGAAEVATPAPASPDANGFGAPSPTPRRDPQAATIVALALIGSAAGAGVPVDVGIGPVLPGQTVGVDAARVYGPPTAVANPSLAPPSRAPQRAASPDTTGDSAAWPAGSWAIGFRYAQDSRDVLRWVRVEILPEAPGPG